jgi:Tfp pilus assembly protein PilN
MLPEIVLFGSPAPDMRIGQAAQIARTVFSDIADELLRSLEFYKSQVGDVKVDQIILTGPGCMIPQLDQFFMARMNIKTICADPMRDYVFDKEMIVERMRPILAALLGSSIETSWNPSFTVDLDLNKEGRLPLMFDDRQTQLIAPDERPTPWFRPMLITGCAALALVGGDYAFLNQYDMPRVVQETEDLQTEELANKKKLTQLNKLREDNDILFSKKRILDNIVKKSERWSEYLDFIRRDVPEGVHISLIEFNKDGLHISGSARDFSNVSRLAVNLGNESLLQSVTVENASRDDKMPELIKFTVVASMVPSGLTAAMANEPVAPVATGGTTNHSTLLDAVKQIKSMRRQQ